MGRARDQRAVGGDRTGQESTLADALSRHAEGAAYPAWGDGAKRRTAPRRDGMLSRLTCHILHLAFQISSLLTYQLNIVPLSVYLKGSWIKITIGVGKGKKLHDKRHDEKQKTMKKEINSALKR